MDQIADMLTRIRNAQRAKKADLEMPCSNFKIALARLLEKKGYLNKVEIVSEGKKTSLKLGLKYLDNEPAIKNIKQISKQGQRIYVGKGEIPYVKNGYGMAIISTPKGVLADKEAREQKLGGEVICEVW
ncbi:MAG TPA: 30S ribosomal protein S8 [Candidatus Moranbacteria bacterium]|nr:30S ribosomal protein S8 [Candidatus Moranbacteria bacterium]